MAIKKQIVQYINQNKEEDVDEYSISDIFYSEYPNNGKLTFCGFKLLRKLYTFYEVKVELQNTAHEFMTLLSYIDGLYYISKTRYKNIFLIHTTDQKFYNRMKIIKGNFKKLQESFDRQ